MSANLKVKEPDFMKPLFAFGLVAVFLASAFPVAAQIGSQHALGGTAATAGMSRPLGGIAGASGGTRRRSGGTTYARPYAYSFYVPNYFDSYYGSDYNAPYAPAYPYDSSAFAPPLAPPPPQVAAPPAAPVIINQYFGVPPPGPYEEAPSQTSQSSGSLSNDPQAAAAGDNYYLIAYKNHSVYTALAYWVEDKTLNYVTAGNTHNQASLDLIDLDLTKTLNQARGVAFSIAGK